VVRWDCRRALHTKGVLFGYSIFIVILVFAAGFGEAMRFQEQCQADQSLNNVSHNCAYMGIEGIKSDLGLQWAASAYLYKAQEIDKRRKYFWQGINQRQQPYATESDAECFLIRESEAGSEFAIISDKSGGNCVTVDHHQRSDKQACNRSYQHHQTPIERHQGIVDHGLHRKKCIDSPGQETEMLRQYVDTDQLDGER